MDYRTKCKNCAHISKARLNSMPPFMPQAEQKAFVLYSEVLVKLASSIERFVLFWCLNKAFDLRWICLMQARPVNPLLSDTPHEQTVWPFIKNWFFPPLFCDIQGDDQKFNLK